MEEPSRSLPVGWRRWLPGIALLAEYQRGWLGRDLVAGLVLTTLLVPAGMAYAEASGLAAVNGLYATVVSLAAYFLIGPSRTLIVGPDSSLTPIIAATIIPLAAAGSDRAAGLAAVLAILTGGLMLVGGLARFGFITELLSKPLRYGYLNGIALTILVSQLPKLCGFSTDADGVVDGVQSFVQGVADGDVEPTALALGLGSLAVMVVARRFVRWLPGAFVAVMASIAAVVLLDIADVPLVGVLPRARPLPPARR